MTYSIMLRPPSVPFASRSEKIKAGQLKDETWQRMEKSSYQRSKPFQDDKGKSWFFRPKTDDTGRYYEIYDAYLENTYFIRDGKIESVREGYQESPTPFSQIQYHHQGYLLRRLEQTIDKSPI